MALNEIRIHEATLERTARVARRARKKKVALAPNHNVGKNVRRVLRVCNFCGLRFETTVGDRGRAKQFHTQCRDGQKALAWLETLILHKDFRGDEAHIKMLRGQVLALSNHLSRRDVVAPSATVVSDRKRGEGDERNQQGE